MPTTSPPVAAVIPRAMRRMSSAIDVSRTSFAHSIRPPPNGILDAVSFDVHSALDPQSTFLKVWHQLLLVAILYELVLIPFVVTFQPLEDIRWERESVIFYIVEFLFCVDFWVNLNTGSVQDRNRSRSRLKYIKSASFVLDVIAIVPLSLFPLPLSPSTSRMYLEINKFLRLHRIPQYLTNLDDIYATHFGALKILRTIIGTLLLSHYIACVRFWFGYDDHHDNHWLPKRLDTPSTQTEYLRSLFWAFGLLTGLFEGELPHKNTEFVFTIVVALCGFSVFTYLCGMFFMLSKCESGNSEEAEARINQLKHVMAFHRVPERLQIQAVDYLKRYSTDDESNDREAIKLLCPSIAKDLQVELLKDTVAQIPVFASCSDEFVRALTSSLEVMFLPAHCTVFHIGEEGDAMYIIHSGVVDIVLGAVKVRELRKGDFVGEMSLFSNRARSATVVTATFSILYRLSRFHTEKVLEGYPRFVSVIQQAVLDLIVQAGQQLTLPAGGGDSQQDEPKGRERRASIFSSQLVRMMSRASSFSPRKSVVVPEGVDPSRFDPGRMVVKQEDTRTVESPPKKIIGKLRRALTVKQHKGNDNIQLFDHQYARQQSETDVKQWGWHRLLFKSGIDEDSRGRLWWLLVLQLVLIYDWVMTPLQLAFSAVDFRVWYIVLLHVLVDIVSFADIYLNFNLSYTHNSEKIMDTSRSGLRYLKTNFAIDMLLVFPYWWYESQWTRHGVFRLPRLLRLWRLSGHMHEIEKLFHLNSKRKLMLLGGLLLMLCHVVACMYFSTTFLEGYSHEEDAWIPTHDIELHKIGDGSMYQTFDNQTLAAGSHELRIIVATQYFRSFYYATNVLTGLGRTIEPSSDVEYAIALCFMLCGFIITAVVVDNVQKRFTASAFEQKEFFAVRTRIQLFLRRQNAPLTIHHRLNSYLDYWWSAHRGAHIGELLTELPVVYRREILRSICSPALQTLALLSGVRTVLTDLEIAFVDSVRFVLYGQGEFVYHEGDNAHCMYFLLHGSVKLENSQSRSRRVPSGGFFGTRALEHEDGESCFAESAIAASGCILIVLSQQDADKLCGVFSDFIVALLKLEKRLADSKLARFTNESAASAVVSTASSTWLSRLFDAVDPDSVHVLVWETWLFVAMTTQWVITLYRMSFGVNPNHFAVADGLTTFLELSFLFDVYMRARVGYHEYGNKIMDVRLIRRRYLHSTDFAIDMAALVPLFAVNHLVGGIRYELLNINKLVRLLKVPGQFNQLGQRYLKRTNELRITKLVYYTFLLTHVSACVYHDFSSHLSLANLMDPDLDSRKTAFGWNLWLLPSSLEDAGKGLQYFSSLFWSFGLMSASYQGELPKTAPQSLFSVMTMMCGFFLFAYVIGNFADVIEIVDAENREFNARLGSVRHLLTHFALPDSVSTKLKGFFSFRRYHTITQEHLIEASLPPSLVTDIRLLNLQPMISKVPFMGGMEPVITRMLVAQFSQVLVLKGDFVYCFGDDGTDMFFVFTGALAVMSHRMTKFHARASRSSTGRADTSATTVSDGDIDLNALRQASELVSGDFFGENALFSDSPRSAFVLAKTSCILYALSRESLNLVFDLYPNWKKHVMQSIKVQQKQHRVAATGRILEHSSSGFSTRDAAATQDDEEDSAKCTPMLPSLPQPHHHVLVQAKWRRGCAWLLTSFTRGTEVQGSLHIGWLRLIVCCTVFNALLGPYRISVDALERWTGAGLFVRLLDILCDILFVVDIWVNWHLKESALSVELYEQNLLELYKKERLVWDIVAAVPIDYVLLACQLEGAAWFRLLRCVKVANLMSYMNEINRQSASYEWARLRAISLLYAITMFWAACAYLALGVYGGYDTAWNAWAPSHEIHYDDPENPESHQVLLRFFRGAFFATTAFVKKARTFFPLTAGHLVFSITISFIGVLAMAFMIGEIASLYISLIGNQVNFRKNHISVELFLSRYKISDGLRDRVHVFLSTLWASHSGVNYEAVLAELPAKMRTDTILHIADVPLDAFLEGVFRPLMRTDLNGIKVLLRELAHDLKFEGYPRGENVIAEGVISNAMYFVVHGQLLVSSTTNSVATARVKRGQYFGERGIITLSVSVFSVRTLKVCDLFSLSSDSLIRILKSHSFLHLAFKAADEVVSNLRAQSHDGISVPTDIKPWKAVLRSVLERQRNEWIASGTASTSSSSKGATQWSALLVDILDGDAKEGGLRFFEQLFRLLTPNGIIFERPCDEVVLAREARKSNASAVSSRGRLRDMVLKLSSATTLGNNLSAKSRSATESAGDRVQTFVQDECE